MKRFLLGLAATSAIGSLSLISTAQPPEGGRKGPPQGGERREGQPPREGPPREGQPPREGPPREGPGRQGRPGGREGQPGGRPMGGGFEVGKVLPPFAAEQLRLTDDQKSKIAVMEKEIKEKLALILTADQFRQLENSRPPMRGGRPGAEGGPGGPGGPDGPPERGSRPEGGFGGRPGAEGGPPEGGRRPEGGPGGRRPEGGRRPDGGERRPPLDD